MRKIGFSKKKVYKKDKAKKFVVWLIVIVNQIQKEL